MARYHEPVDRRSWILLTFLALFVSLAFQGTRGLYDPSEGRYAEVAREMRASGNYLEPVLAHHPHWTKPPLTYWTIAAGLAVAGDNTWGVRAFNAMAFVITTLAVAAIATTLWGSPTGLFAGLIYLSSLLPVVGSNVATADTLLTMWTTLALLAYVRARTRLMWLMFGMAFFTKGPPALLPLLAIVVFHIAARRRSLLLDSGGIVLFVASAFWWYGLMVFRHHELLGYFVGKEIVARNTTGAFHRNGHWYGAWVVYAPVLLLGSGLWIVDALHAVRKRWRPVIVRGSTSSLLFLWIVIPLALFALSRSRLPLYLLPLHAAVAIATARGLSLNHAKERAVLRRAMLSIVLLVALKGAFLFIPSEQDATRLYREARSSAGTGARLALYAESSMYGFQFYAGDDLARLSRSGTEWWADGNLATALTSHDHPLAILTNKGHAAELETALRATRVSFTRANAGNQDMFVIGAPERRLNDGALARAFK